MLKLGTYRKWLGCSCSAAALAFCAAISFITDLSAPPLAAAQEVDVWDPIEPVNRGIFWFNDQFDIYILEPVARGYDDVVPDPIQEGIGNFFENLRYPRYLVSDVVQLKFTQAAEHTGRFIINSTIGLLGFIDVAKHVGLEQHSEDFGLALAYYDVPPGPYLVIPILGPSNLRDGVGKVVDSFLDPIGALTYTDVDDDVAIPVIIGAKIIEAIDTRADLLEAVETAKESSIDYYLFTQGAYYQYRRGLLYDGDPPDEEEDDFSDEQPEGVSAAEPLPITPGIAQAVSEDGDMH
ncbi:MAG: VacJ family lipoprotein [Deltaproteobacteria bacterium]|nr:VacJ family lipoprotein [Deltaproteobacteria bacterium]